MSAKGFTPGPWRLSGRTIYALNDEGFNRFSALVQDAHAPAYELNANARLIASAPTLLEALTLAASKPLAQHCTDEEWEFIRSAILGAQGEQV